MSKKRAIVIVNYEVWKRHNKGTFTEIGSTGPSAIGLMLPQI
jgi:hypothetical protein